MFQFRKNKVTVIIIGLIVYLLFITQAICQGKWTQGNFEIHVFKVGQGDSQLIVSPTGKTLLIDVAEMNWNSGKVSELVAGKIHEIMGEDCNHLDYIVATHLHLDHIGYVGYGGIWALVEKHGFTLGKLIDRDAGVWEDKNNDGVCDPEKEIVWHYAGTTSGTGKKWLCYATNPVNANKLNREIAIVGAIDQIDLGQDITVTVVESDAEDVMMEDRSTSINADLVDTEDHPSENDYSITLKITFGKLDYVSGGDTDGEYSTSPWGYSYNDVESVIAPKIGKVEILHANHHGSAHSSNETYVTTLDPDITLISCGYDNIFGHPAQSSLDRLLATSIVYMTEQCAIDRDYGNSIFVNGDIVVKSGDGIEYSVNGDIFTARDP